MVVDVQDCYEKEFAQQRTRFERMLKKIEEKVALAREGKEPVISIICPSDGPPIQEVKEVLGNKIPTLRKCAYDGSREIDRYIKRTGITPDPIELCGVFANVCVLYTWIGLQRLGYKLQHIDQDAVMFVPTSKTRVQEYPDGYIKT